MNPGSFFREVVESHNFRLSDSLEGDFWLFWGMALSLCSCVR